MKCQRRYSCDVQIEGAVRGHNQTNLLAIDVIAESIYDAARIAKAAVHDDAQEYDGPDAKINFVDVVAVRRREPIYSDQ